MKQVVAKALSRLKGLPLWRVGRAGSLVWIQLGRRRVVPTCRGGAKEVGELALHLDCSWRLTGPGGELLASDESAPEVLAGLASLSLVCRGMRAGEHGDFELELSGGRRLHVEPVEADCSESWRLLKPYSDLPHFVVGYAGVDPEG
jgi:hypothetical protein